MALNFEVQDSVLSFKGKMTARIIEKDFMIFKQSIKSRENSSILTVNWHEVTELDSSCLALIMWLQSQQEEQVKMVNVPERLQVLADLYDLSPVFKGF